MARKATKKSPAVPADDQEFDPAALAVGVEPTEDDQAEDYVEQPPCDHSGRPLPDDGRKPWQLPRPIYRFRATEWQRRVAGESAEAYEFGIELGKFHNWNFPIAVLSELPLIVFERLGAIVGGGSEINVRRNILIELTRVGEAMALVEEGINRESILEAEEALNAAKAELRELQDTDPELNPGERLATAQSRRQQEIRVAKGKIDELERRHSTAKQRYERLVALAPKQLLDVSRARQAAVRADRFHTEEDLKAAQEVIHEWAKRGYPIAEDFMA